MLISPFLTQNTKQRCTQLFVQLERQSAQNQNYLKYSMHKIWVPSRLPVFGRFLEACLIFSLLLLSPAQSPPALFSSLSSSVLFYRYHVPSISQDQKNPCIIIWITIWITSSCMSSILEQDTEPQTTPDGKVLWKCKSFYHLHFYFFFLYNNIIMPFSTSVSASDGPILLSCDMSDRRIQSGLIWLLQVWLPLQNC